MLLHRGKQWLLLVFLLVVAGVCPNARSVVIHDHAISVADNVSAFSVRVPMQASNPRVEKVEALLSGDDARASNAQVLDAIARQYGWQVKSVTYRQISGPTDGDLPDPKDDLTMTMTLHAANMAALSAHYNKGCGIHQQNKSVHREAKARKKVADGGGVTVLERMLLPLARALDITIIIGGSEGATRDGAPAMTVKQVINPGGKNGIYVAHFDPVENTNAQAMDEAGSWVLFFLTKLADRDTVALLHDVEQSELSLQDFLTKTTGEDLARYNIPLCHDRYIISVSYPGKKGTTKRAQFHPANDNLRTMLQAIADEHEISLEDLGQKAHLVFLDRTRHKYLEDGADELQEAGNEITYTFGDLHDGDAFDRTVGPLGISTYQGKPWTIVFGASGAIEGFASGLATGGRESAAHNIVARVSMVHSGKRLKREDLTGWNDYSDDDRGDFTVLGITHPDKVITEADVAQYPERIAVFPSITGARPNIDIAADNPIKKVRIEENEATVEAFTLDRYGRGLIAEVVYETENEKETSLRMRADNDYGLLDDNGEVRRFILNQYLTATSDEDRAAWLYRLATVVQHDIATRTESESVKRADHNLVERVQDGTVIPDDFQLARTVDDATFLARVNLKRSSPEIIRAVYDVLSRLYITNFRTRVFSSFADDEPFLLWGDMVEHNYEDVVAASEYVGEQQTLVIVARDLDHRKQLFQMMQRNPLKCSYRIDTIGEMRLTNIDMRTVMNEHSYAFSTLPNVHFTPIGEIVDYPGIKESNLGK